MNDEFFDALKLLGKEKGIPAEYLAEKIRLAILNAVKRDYGASDNAAVEIDIEAKKFSVSIRKDVVPDPAEIENKNTQISLEEAEKYSTRALADGFVDIPLETKRFGRIAAQAAKHIIRQGIREAERVQALQEFQSKEHEIVSATVTKVDPVREVVTVDIGKSESILPKSEQIPGETIKEGSYIKVYIVDVAAGDKGPKVLISRTHPGFVKRLFEMEVPEIYDGTVEIKAISREAGSRTKIAVWSKDHNVDPVGACIGPKGERINTILKELGGEKIDIIKYSENLAEYVAAALAPSKVTNVVLPDPNVNSCQASVPDHQLSLAIGNKGQNARLAAKLTGCKIDIKPESGYFGEEPAVQA
ncbi:MAG: transcription termination factor NusA [Oscillospiraceae bacterium]|jgi:N utilization substance protein A|nr:transcription termination factor NusA [Oscillospiraceae bacterium]